MPLAFHYLAAVAQSAGVDTDVCLVKEYVGIIVVQGRCLEQGVVRMTDLKGEYKMTLHSADSVVIRFSMVGYQTKTRVLRRPRGNQKLQVTLPPMQSLQEVVVTEKRRQTTGTEQLDVKNIRHTPSTTGNAVEELVQQQAGVSTHNEMSSQYNVRGGSFDENSVYINSVEVYRPLLIRSGQQERKSTSPAEALRRNTATRCLQHSTFNTAAPPDWKATCMPRC